MGLTELNMGSIVIVDDNPNNLHVLSSMLQTAGFKIRPALDGKVALRSIMASPPDLILLDIRMPGMDGYEICKQLKADEQTREIPVIFISALNETEDIVAAFQAGGTDYVTKPFQKEEVMARVRTHLQLYRMQQAERKQIETKLAQSKSDLRRFAEVTAHHLQEPARRMANYAGRLRTQLAGRIDDSEIQLSLDFICNQAHYQLNLLNDVECYLEADQPRGEIKSVDAKRTVSALLEKKAVSISAAGAEINCGNLPHAHIDAPRLAELFGIALENALRYGKGERPLRITIDGERHGPFVRYRVSDNGPGIDAEYRERMFQVFERMGSSGDVANTGIGLAIMRRIAESSGGRAWIEESSGGGCCVLFELLAEETF
ncbi:MAG: response regulator [Sterolibacterium sp.]|nr:response regulator [Sterolibacterium sp.]